MHLLPVNRARVIKIHATPPRRRQMRAIAVKIIQ
jgi:hypothetical protein